MRNALTYKGYAAKIEFDAEDHIFFGRIVGIRDIVTFHGATVEELETSFTEAVDHYLETCAKRGEEPNKPYSGTLTLRLSPEIHAEIAAAATVSGKSINKWAAEMLDKAVHAQ
jgi:predicted HicB family RNase H-like nuclease